jgi:hypothetical protein
MRWLVLALPPGTTGISDRNYRAPDLTVELAPYQTRKHDPDPARSRRLGSPRWEVETVNDQLADRYQAKRVWVRDLRRLCHRVIHKALSHTAAVWLNAAGLPPVRFADLKAA